MFKILFSLDLEGNIKHLPNFQAKQEKNRTCSQLSFILNVKTKTDFSYQFTKKPRMVLTVNSCRN